MTECASKLKLFIGKAATYSTHRWWRWSQYVLCVCVYICCECYTERVLLNCAAAAAATAVAVAAVTQYTECSSNEYHMQNTLFGTWENDWALGNKRKRWIRRFAVALCLAFFRVFELLLLLLLLLMLLLLLCVFFACPHIVCIRLLRFYGSMFVHDFRGCILIFVCLFRAREREWARGSSI